VYVASNSESEARSTGYQPVIVSSRQELFHQICKIVHEIAPSWRVEDVGGSAVIILTNPQLGCTDVQSIFDEIAEKYHVAGIGLHFDKPGGWPVHVTFVMAEL
jgi:hypothetical protein